MSVDTRRRDLLDLHVARRLDAALHLRLALQNILGADTWQLATQELGQRTCLLSLEGKW